MRKNFLTARAGPGTEPGAELDDLQISSLTFSEPCPVLRMEEKTPNTSLLPCAVALLVINLSRAPNTRPVLVMKAFIGSCLD